MGLMSFNLALSKRNIRISNTIVVSYAHLMQKFVELLKEIV